jgi:hypothetical protein
MKNRKKLYIAALDCKSTFGSVSHQLLKINLEKNGIPRTLRNLIMDSYDKGQVRTWRAGSALEPNDIKKAVKQGCSLSSLLFNICVDPLILYIRKFKDEGYKIDERDTATIHDYADDVILVANSEESLQLQVNRAKNFLTLRT